MPGYTPLHEYTQAVRVAFFAIAALAAASVLVNLTWLVTGTAPLADELLPTALRQIQAASVYAGVTVLCLWTLAAYRNLDAVSPGARRFRVEWAIAGWLIPIVNLFRPVQLINDVFQAGRGGGAAGANLVTGWWLAWITAGVFSSLSRMSLEGTAQLLCATAAGVGFAAAAVLAALTITKATRLLHQEATLIEHRPTGRFTRPAPATSAAG